MQVSAIVAMSDNRVIGKNNGLPWHLPADLHHFKTLTMGKPIIMGRKTHEAIGRLLPGRLNVIITRNADYKVEGAWVGHSIEGALSVLRGKNEREVMVIGGSQLYKEMLPQLDRIYMTQVHAQIDGDSYFPELDAGVWQQVSTEDKKADADNIFDYSFTIWEKK